MNKVLIIIFLALAIGFAQDSMAYYCAAPPYVGGKTAIVKPRVLISADVTHSMCAWAYHGRFETYDSTKIYYGYANPYATYDRVYIKDTLWRITTGGAPFYYTLPLYFYKKNVAGLGEHSGNEINYGWTMRIDALRKTLTGGRGVSYDNKDTLYFHHYADYWVTFQRGTPPLDNAAITGLLGPHLVGGIITDPTDTFEITTGVIRAVADVDTPYYEWDAEAPMFALQTFAGSTSPYLSRISCPFGTPLGAYLDTLNLTSTGLWTPIGDALITAICYIRYCDDFYNGTNPPWWGDRNNYWWNINAVGVPGYDPWFETVAGCTVSVSCAPTFLILIGDGESNFDSVPDTYWPPDLPYEDSPYDTIYPFQNHNLIYNYAGDDFDTTMPWCGGHNGSSDDIAYYAHIRDLRPDNDSIYGLPGTQNITFYSIFTYGRGNAIGPKLFGDVGKYGGFVDMNQNLIPDLQEEWDTDSDTVPDNYYYAEEGQDVEDAFIDIFIDIEAIARLTSGSAPAITSPGTRSGGFAMQAQFYPAMDVEDTLTLKWIGNVQALWIDPYGWLREETQGNQFLHLQNDRVVEMVYDTTYYRTMARIFEDTLGLGDTAHFDYVGEVPVESLNYVWHAANWLKNVDPDNRKIGVNLGPGFLGQLSFFKTNNSNIDTHLGLNPGSAAQCDSLIQYIRGVDYPNKRCRTYGTKVWKLGDIINSSPVMVEEPDEAYHLIYGDESYYDYWDYYFDRRRMVYFGANDGMIHALNAGTYEDSEGAGGIGIIQPQGRGLGEEMWAVVPKNLLPHLKWLWDTTYCHVYYNDLKVYATDAKIFPADATHINGWGTLLITGMGFGGGEISVGGTNYKSSYLIADITDTDNYPNLMYEFAFNDQGYTTCMPSMMKVGEQWFLIWGTGPQTIYGESDQLASLYVANLGTATIDKFTVPDSNTVITNAFAVDLGLNYSCNLIYFGTYDNDGGGKIYRIMTHEDENPDNWDLVPVIDLDRPITAEGTAATDEYGNLWIYFGAGKYISNIDVADTTTQLFVGIKDDTTQMPAPTSPPVFTFNDLVNVTDVDVFHAESVVGLTPSYISFDSLEATIEYESGWYREFDSLPGERVIAMPAIIGGTVMFTTFIPQDTTGITPTHPDLCVGGGGGPQYGNFWALYFKTGTAYRESILGSIPPHMTHVAVAGDMPSEPIVYIGSKEERVYIQTAGGLMGYETPLVYDPRGGIMLWRGK